MNPVTDIQCSKKEAFLDEELANSERLHFELHLETCNECRNYIENWELIKQGYARWTTGQMDEMAAQPTLAEASLFINRLQSKLESASPTKSPSPILFRRAVLLGLAAAVFITGIIAFLYGRTPHPQSPISTAASRGAESHKPAPLMRLDMTLNRIWGNSHTTRTVHVTNATVLDTQTDDRVIVNLAKDAIGLDSQSQLTIENINEKNAIFSLQRGTAVFDVSPRISGQHFIIHVRDITVSVIGTRFSVESINDNVIVCVQEGTVKIQRENDQLMLHAGHLANLIPQRPLAHASTLLSAEKWASLEQLFVFNADIQTGDTDSISSKVAPPARSLHQPSRRGQNQKNMAQWRQMIIERKYSEAISEIRAYLRGAPGDTEVLMLLATVQQKEGAYDDAFQTYQKVISSSNASQANQARYLAGELAQNHLKNNRQAIIQFENYLLNASETSPNRGEAKFRLSKALLSAGETKRAKAILQEIIDEYRRAPVANRARKQLETLP
ncbi:MAG: FecR domain-containing protein [Deltaproteobacteria bacterium]|nr:FecR domain-containing protein [Deltaproteobacteria bacterium]